MLRTVIVDDERLARRDLRGLLAGSSEVTVVGEAETVRAAVDVIRATEADAVFLDVQLGTELGFDLLPELPPGTKVVFVTAFDRYAIRAFEQNAVDYLLKPVVPQRLTEALRRLQNPRDEPTTSERLAYDEFLFLRVDGRMRFIKVRSVAAVVAEGSECKLWLADGEIVSVRKGIGDWAERLPAPYFARIHRGTIVNLDYVERVEDWSHGSHLVYVKGFKKPVTMSRRSATKVRARIG